MHSFNLDATTKPRRQAAQGNRLPGFYPSVELAEISVVKCSETSLPLLNQSLTQNVKINALQAGTLEAKCFC
ncbi:hypothetical protein O77CONTIG1_01835 [Leptolyngbya sp. O-77]|nr:hypothetical protein O77CONTIG1_01835 [Leptolyngbya sp. O-77]